MKIKKPVLRLEITSVPQTASSVHQRQPLHPPLCPLKSEIAQYAEKITAAWQIARCHRQISRLNWEPKRIILERAVDRSF
jgi:hypothetical protein